MQNYTGLTEAVSFFLEVHSVKDLVPVVMGDLDEHAIKAHAESPPALHRSLNSMPFPLKNENMNLAF